MFKTSLEILEKSQHAIWDIDYERSELKNQNKHGPIEGF